MSKPDLIILALYFLAIVWVGMRASMKRRSGMEDYVLAGRSLSLPAFIATLVPTFYGGVLGVGEFTWKHGFANWLVMGLPYYLFTVIYALFFAGKIRLAHGLTIPDHLETAFGRKTALAGAALIFILTCPADEILMAAILVIWGTGWPLLWALAAVSAIGLIYLLKGGFRSDYFTNRIQIVMMFSGFALIFPFAYMALGGLDYIKHSVPVLHLKPLGGLSPGYVFTWYLIAIWTIVEPSFHQRACAAKDPKTAKNGMLISIAFWFVFDAMTTLSGLYARALMPELENPLMAYPMLAEKILPPVVLGLFIAGMSSSMLANLESNFLISALTLGKDVIGRIFNFSEQKQEKAVRISMLASAVMACAMALWMPSVVDLCIK